MITTLLPLLLVLALAVSAVAGPAVLRHSAPLLMRLPRLGIALLIGGAAAWVLGVLALGPMLAWVLTGPDVLPAAAADVCQRCLAAANPFGAPFLETAVPVVALLKLPAVAAVLHGASVVRDARRRRATSERTSRRLLAASSRRMVQGRSVLVARDRDPFAVTLPRRHGGVVISTGALDLLTPQETAAVLAHEQAHLDQRHHLLTSLMAALTRRLRWVPLLAAAEDALPHYVEIAADDAARREVGTRALASALLILGESTRASEADALHGALFANGADRVRHLVQPGSGTAGVLSAIFAIACLVSLSSLAASVHVPYALAALTGCL